MEALLKPRSPPGTLINADGSVPCANGESKLAELGARRNRRVAKLALVVVSVGAALLASEGLWRLFLPRPGFTPHSELAAPGLILPHPRRS